jgi:hypothetical protein
MLFDSSVPETGRFVNAEGDGKTKTVAIRAITFTGKPARQIEFSGFA